MASEGTFILADIGGYTSFLNEVGIQHAKEITTDLFNTLLRCNKGRWKIANIEGDAIFFYRDEKEPPEHLFSHVRTMFEDFCRRLTDIAGRAACTCGACTRINQLNLKFIVHCGEYDTHKVAGRQELIGPDIVVAHRLLKNSVPLTNYLLMTRAFGATELPLPMVPGRDQFSDINDVDYVYADLEPLRQAVADMEMKFLTEEDSRFVVRTDIAAPPERVWAAVNDPVARRRWSSHREVTQYEGRSGKLGRMHRCIDENGARIVGIVVAVDEEGRRLTERTWASNLVRDIHVTLEVRERPGFGSTFIQYADWEPAVPVVSHLMMPLMTSAVRKKFERGGREMKALCEETPARVS